MKILLYPHGGSGNHGCEAIVRATSKLVNGNLFLYSSAVEQDVRAGLDTICTIYPATQRIKRGSIPHIKASVKYNLLKDKDAFDYEAYRHFFDNADSGTIAMSIGGDNYCYGVPDLFLFLNKYVRKKGAKTVLWGCSVEPSAIHGVMAEDLAQFDLITARESISYEALKKVNPNTVLCADPAFLLDKEEMELPDGFIAGNTVGINLSPLIMERETENGVTAANYQRLIEHILHTMDCQVALIPHVCWPANDDRIPLKELYDRYKETGRVVLLEEHNCEQLKGFIARCRFFIGARTHATIAAYSTGVPTLVVGYSVKARGIARDIFGTEEHYVVPVQELRKPGDLKNAFCWLADREAEIRGHLREIMPEYGSRAYLAKEALERLCTDARGKTSVRTK